MDTPRATGNAHQALLIADPDEAIPTRNQLTPSICAASFCQCREPIIHPATIAYIGDEWTCALD